jgi:hypothetical protein
MPSTSSVSTSARERAHEQRQRRYRPRRWSGGASTALAHWPMEACTSLSSSASWSGASAPIVHPRRFCALARRYMRRAWRGRSPQVDSGQSLPGVRTAAGSPSNYWEPGKIRQTIRYRRSGRLLFVSDSKSSSPIINYSVRGIEPSLPAAREYWTLPGGCPRFTGTEAGPDQPTRTRNERAEALPNPPAPMVIWSLRSPLMPAPRAGICRARVRAFRLFACITASTGPACGRSQHVPQGSAALTGP